MKARKAKGVNTVFRVLVTPEMARALRWFRKEHYSRSTDLEIVACLLLWVALSRPRVLSSWITAWSHYREAEGFNTHALAFAFLDSQISARPEYSTVR
jgi:hypothetical protein